MSTISAGTTSNTALKQTGDTTGNLVLQTNGTTTAMTISSAQIVSLTSSLALLGSTSGSVSLTAPAVAGTQSYTLPTAQPTANGQALVATTAGAMSWATASATPGGSSNQFQYNSGGTSFGGASNFTYNATGPIVSTTIGVGAATPSASGSGVTFPATQSASSDVNTLDDYEEGTWTPSIGGTATYTTQIGTYTKIGNVVTVSGQLVINVVGSGSSTVISGLPFSSAATYSYGVSIGKFSSIVNTAYTVYGQMPPSLTTFEIFCTIAAGTGNYVTGVFGNSANIVFSLTYRV